MGAEKKFQDQCIDYLKSQKIYHINIFGNGWSGKGAPDIIACLDGRFVAFELKVKNNQMQADQIVHKNRIEKSGGVHYTPRSIDEFKSIIKGLQDGESRKATRGKGGKEKDGDV